MAAFFAINVIEFPRDTDGGGLHLGWVFRYMFGISFAISVPLVILAFLISDIRGWVWQLKKLLGKEPKRSDTSAGRQNRTSPTISVPPARPNSGTEARSSADLENLIPHRRYTRFDASWAGANGESREMV